MIAAMKVLIDGITSRIIKKGSDIPWQVYYMMPGELRHTKD